MSSDFADYCLKPWEELTVADNFIFQKVMLNKEICRRFLESLLNIVIAEINFVISEYTLEISRDNKGVRLDVYVKDNTGRVYNIEMQTASVKQGILAKRSRYYQAIIDVNNLQKGDDYAALPETVVIFVCTFDPFGYSQKCYKFENRCEGKENLLLGDGAKRVFLYSKGEINNVTEDIADFLSLIEGKKTEGEFAKLIEKEVSRLKHREETREEYMILSAQIMDARREGRAEGREEGQMRSWLSDMRNVMQKMGYTAGEAMDLLGIPEDKRKIVAANI